MTLVARSRNGVPIAAMLALLWGCVNITINFPQEKIENAASNVEDLVRGGKEAPPLKPAPAKPEEKKSERAPLRNAVGWLAPAPAEAQEVPELKVRTPEVMASIESRRQRFPQIQQWKAKGCIGENNRGLVEARPGQGCGGEAASLIAGENNDRMTLYRTLLEQNKMRPGDLGRIQAAFAKVNREKAAPNEWIQNEDGAWVRK